MVGALDIRSVLLGDDGAGRSDARFDRDSRAIADRPPSVAITSAGRVRVRTSMVDTELNPMWLRERCRAEGSVDTANGQRLFEPTDLPSDLFVTGCAIRDHGSRPVLEVIFSDGHRSTIAVEAIEEAASPVPDTPAPTPWLASTLETLPVFDYGALATGGRDAVVAKRDALEAFFTLGFFLLRRTPAVPGALHDITAHFGRISGTNFGVLFDVRTEAVPVDLAYTPVALSAHTDQPYRAPVPGLQFLHTITNEARGGASTIVDGLAAVDALATADPEAHDMLCALPIEFRYDIGTDVKVDRAPIIERRDDGTLRQFRFSPRLDFAPLVSADELDVYYRGRHWLAGWLNDPGHQIDYEMTAGDVLVVDNHRVLHGRTSFDPTIGDRHLQGCYIDHDGPVSEWILANRLLGGDHSSNPAP